MSPPILNSLVIISKIFLRSYSGRYIIRDGYRGLRVKIIQVEFTRLRPFLEFVNIADLSCRLKLKDFFQYKVRKLVFIQKVSDKMIYFKQSYLALFMIMIIPLHHAASLIVDPFLAATYEYCFYAANQKDQQQNDHYNDEDCSGDITVFGKI